MRLCCLNWVKQMSGTACVCVSGAVLSKMAALSEVAENDSRQKAVTRKQNTINTNINNSTIVSDNLEKSNNTGTVLLLILPSSFFL